MLPFHDSGIVDGTFPFRLDVLLGAVGHPLSLREDWPVAAAHAIALGLDTPSLVPLASEYRMADPVSIRELVSGVEIELGLDQPMPAVAARCLSLMICDQLVGRSLTVADASRLIFDVTDHGAFDWDMYCAFATFWDWDETPWQRKDIAATIERNARAAVGSNRIPLERLIVSCTGGAAVDLA